MKKSEAPWKDVANFKKSLVDNLQEQSSALLLDPHYALPISMDIFNPRKGLIVTLEDSILKKELVEEFLKVLIIGQLLK